MERKGTNRTANESARPTRASRDRARTNDKGRQTGSTLAEPRSVKRGPHAARKRRSILQPAPPSKWRQRPRSGCARGAPEGVGGATGGSVLPAGGGKRKVRSKVR
jgi:hypothetical protein